MLEERSFEVTITDGPALRGILTLPDRPGPRPAVVICHGFKGFMEWGFFPHLAQLLAERGLVAVRFNFTSSGMAPGDERVTDEAAFRRATFSQDLREILSVLAAAAGDLAPGRIDVGRLGLFGHSRGGGGALLAAACEDWRERLQALVTWAAVSRCDRFTAEQKTLWRRRGALPIANARTGQELALGIELLQDLEHAAGALDLLAAARRRTAPWLILHGEQDETVPAAEAQELAAAARPPPHLEIVPGGSHTFGARHPFAGPTPQLIQALNATQRWFLAHLAER